MIKQITVLYILLIFNIANSQELNNNLLKSIAFFDINQFDSAIVYASKVNDANIVKMAIQIKAESYFNINKFNDALSEFLKFTNKNAEKNALFIAKIYSQNQDWDNTDKWLRLHLKSEYKINLGVIKIDTFFTKFSKTKLWNNLWIENWQNSTDEKIADVEYLTSKNKYTEALEISDEICVLQPNCYKNYYIRAQIYNKLTDVNNEIYSYKNALKYSPNNDKYNFQYAKCLLNAEKYKKAYQEFEKTKAINPYFPRISYYLALSNFKLGDYEKTINYITEYRKIMPTDEDAIWLAGYAYKENLDYEKAITIFDEGIKTAKQKVGLFIGKGESLYNLQKYGEAAQAFTLALDYDPQNGNIYYLRGLAYIETDNKTNACRDWEKAVKFGFFKANDLISINCQK